MKFNGRVLYLTDMLLIYGDSSMVSRLMREDDKHFAVNTDAMISSQACTLGYTPEILNISQNFKEVIDEDDVRQGGFQVVVVVILRFRLAARWLLSPIKAGIER